MLEKNNDKIIISKNNISQAIEYLQKVGDAQHIEICIMQDSALDIEFLKQLCNAHANICFNIMYDENDNRAIFSERYCKVENWNNRSIDFFTPDYLMYSKEETKIFVENYNYIRSHFGSEMVINNEFTVEMAINATNKVNQWVEEINKASINGESLSPFEKYLYAYQIVSKFVYKVYEQDDGWSRNSRDIVSVLNTDYIVCSGYAKLLTEICKKIGIQCDCQMLNNHQICTIDLEDKKYKIKGRFLSDPTRGNYLGQFAENAIDLYKSLLEYHDSFYKVFGGEIKVSKHNYLVDYKVEDVLGESFENYKQKVAAVMLEQVENVLKKIAGGKTQKDSRDNKKDIEADVKLFLNSYGMKKNAYLERIIWVYQYCNISIDEIKEIIIESFKEISFEDPMVMQEQKQAYFDFRRINAEMPSVEDFITAYENTLIAQGIFSKKERIKIIKETLKASAIRSAKESYFSRKGMGKSEAQKVFDRMSFGISTFFNKD